MTKTKCNDVFMAIAHGISFRNDDRCVVDFTNGDTMLIDFSACGEPFETDCVAIYSLQRPIKKEDGSYGGTEELDYGAFTQYSEVYDFVVRTLNQQEGCIYVESF